MRKNPVSLIFDIPQYSYFSFGNRFTGSLGNLSYQITPKEDITLKIWHGRLCSDLAEIEIEKTYPNTEEGFREAIKFLESVPREEQ